MKTIIHILFIEILKYSTHQLQKPFGVAKLQPAYAITMKKNQS